MASTAVSETGAAVRKSRVGKRPIAVPKGVTINLNQEAIEVKGPKGTLSRKLPGQVAVKREGDELSVESSAPGRDAPRLQGLTRALIASMVKGVVDGFERTLELVGTGYRCEVKGKSITLNLGFSHPTAVNLPPGVSAMSPPDSKGTLLILSSADKATLGELSAKIRALRPPEPYGGKGIRYRGETIRRKAGKAGKAKK